MFPDCLTLVKSFRAEPLFQKPDLIDMFSLQLYLTVCLKSHWIRVGPEGEESVMIKMQDA